MTLFLLKGLLGWPWEEKQPGLEAGTQTTGSASTASALGQGTSPPPASCPRFPREAESNEPPWSGADLQKPKAVRGDLEI